MLHADDAMIEADAARAVAHRRAVYDCTGTGYAVLDAAGRIMAATPRMTRMLAATPTNVPGQPFVRFVADAAQASFFQQLAAAQQHGTAIAAVTLQHADGQQQQVMLHLLAWPSNGSTQWLIALLGPAAPPASQQANTVETTRELVHHINNRLMVINTSSELISMLVDAHATRGTFDGAETQRRAHAITHATEEVAAALQRLVALANAPSPH